MIQILKTVPAYFEFPHNDEEIAANSWKEITQQKAIEYYKKGFGPTWLTCDSCTLYGGTNCDMIYFHNSNVAFFVGESHCTSDFGETIRMAVVEVDKRYFAKPQRLVSHAGKYRQEIRKMLDGRHNNDDIVRDITQALNDNRVLIKDGLTYVEVSSHTLNEITLRIKETS